MNAPKEPEPVDLVIAPQKPPVDPVIQWGAFAVGVATFLIWAYATLTGKTTDPAPPLPPVPPFSDVHVAHTLDLGSGVQAFRAEVREWLATHWNDAARAKVLIEAARTAKSAETVEIAKGKLKRPISEVCR